MFFLFFPSVLSLRDFLQIVNNTKNGHGLSTRATREKCADRKRNDFKTQVPVTAPPAHTIFLFPCNSYNLLQ